MVECPPTGFGVVLLLTLVFINELNNLKYKSSFRNMMTEAARLLTSSILRFVLDHFKFTYKSNYDIR